MTKWYLIPEEVVKLIRDTFERFIKYYEYHEGGADYSKWIEKRLHNFDTSVHITDAVPEDFKGGKPSNDLKI